MAIDLLDKMATFVRVVEAGSFSSAARQLRISAAAVSRQIAALEAELGASLFLRTTRKMTITTAGQRYYERCLRILRDVDDARTVGRGSGVEGMLRITAPVSFGLACVVPAMSPLLAKHPSLRVDLRLEDRLIDLVFEGVDVAIRVGSPPPESSELIAHRLFEYRRAVVAAPAYLKRRGEPKTPEALAKHDVLVHATDPEAWHLASTRREARVRLNPVVRTNALHAVRALAIEGVGIAMLPPWFVAEAVARAELQIVLSEWRSHGVTVVHALHRTAHRGEHRVKALIDHLRTTYSKQLECSR